MWRGVRRSSGSGGGLWKKTGCGARGCLRSEICAGGGHVAAPLALGMRLCCVAVRR